MKTYIVTDASGAIQRSGVCPDGDVDRQFAVPLLGFTIPNDAFQTVHVDDSVWRVDVSRRVLTGASGDGPAVTPV